MWEKSWPSLEIINLDRSLDEVEKLVRHPPREQPDEATRALARFLVVRTTGYLERVVRECCLSYIISKSERRVSTYATATFRNYLNPTPDRLLKIVRAFDSTWQTELAELFNDEDQLLSREISFLVDRRNKIAHGMGENVTASRALELLGHAKDLAEWFVAQFDPR